MTQAEFAQFRPELALVPVGSTEVHGMHLPYGMDWMQMDVMARRAVGDANERGGRVLMLPTLPYGIDTNMMEFPYTITLRPRTLIQVLAEIVESLEHHGVPKVLLLGGHFQNHTATEVVCQEFAGRPIFVAKLDWWLLVQDVREQVLETTGDHADEFETSLGLALFPDLIHMGRAAESPTKRSRLEKLLEYGGAFARPWHKFTVNGGTGNPQKGTAEKGRQLVDAVVSRLTDVLLELSEADVDETFPY
jgi:creatinine amidohydrolase